MRVLIIDIEFEMMKSFLFEILYCQRDFSTFQTKCHQMCLLEIESCWSLKFPIINQSSSVPFPFSQFSKIKNAIDSFKNYVITNWTTISEEKSVYDLWSLNFSKEKKRVLFYITANLTKTFEKNRCNSNLEHIMQ